MSRTKDAIRSLRIGGYVTGEVARGDCPDCGGQCAPQCGLHPLGCVFGGFGRGYWLIAYGCNLDHAESGPDRRPDDFGSQIIR